MKPKPDDIPQEIHDLILDYFVLPPPTAWHDRDTLESAENRAILRAYAMVSRSFCVAAYSRLFSSAILRLKVSSPAFNKRLFASAIQVIRRFVTLLQDSLNFPNLGMIYHIRSFCLTISGAPSHDSSFSYKFLRDATVYRIIDILHGPNHGIESLSFNARIGHFTLEYTKMDDQLICAFENILRSPNLQHVRLCGLFGIPRSLFHGIHFKNLELYETRLTRGKIEVDAPHVTILESIGLDESFSLVDLLHLGNRSANVASRYQSAFVELHTLYFQAKLTGGIQNIINIAGNAANTLHILHIQLIGHDWLQSSGPSHSLPTAIYPFHLLSRLSSLRISYKDIGIYLHDIIDPFCRVLQSCSFPRSLRKFNLEMTASHNYNAPYLTMNTPNEWPVMDSVLVQPMFNAVPQVNIILNYFIKRGGYSFGDALVKFHKHLLSAPLPKFTKSRQNTSSSYNVIITKPRDRSDATELTFKCGGWKKVDIPSQEG
ncbi:hypothetical protein BJ912DRAFT_332690 [Pholiota molesta]|nr:hypothetical protein BJ912DRAFT_332690 [Pholiota molesta]